MRSGDEQISPVSNTKGSSKKEWTSALNDLKQMQRRRLTKRKSVQNNGKSSTEETRQVRDTDQQRPAGVATLAVETALDTASVSSSTAPTDLSKPLIGGVNCSKEVGADEDKSTEALFSGASACQGRTEEPTTRVELLPSIASVIAKAEPILATANQPGLGHALPLPESFPCKTGAKWHGQEVSPTSTPVMGSSALAPMHGNACSHGGWHGSSEEGCLPSLQSASDAWLCNGACSPSPHGANSPLPQCAQFAQPPHSPRELAAPAQEHQEQVKGYVMSQIAVQEIVQVIKLQGLCLQNDMVAMLRTHLESVATMLNRQEGKEVVRKQAADPAMAGIFKLPEPAPGTQAFMSPDEPKLDLQNQLGCKTVEALPTARVSEEVGARSSFPLLATPLNKFATVFTGAHEKMLKRTAVRAQRLHVFPNAASMKRQLRQDLIRKPYNVFDFYKEGVIPTIAMSGYFEMVTLCVILLNALWIAYDTDANDADSLPRARLQFQIAENIFCSFFFSEWIIRFLSFRRIIDGMKDFWFAYDSVLLCQMTIETWGVYVLYWATDGLHTLNTGAFVQFLKMLRMCRTARIMRLLRKLPELLVIVHGIRTAMRSMFFTLLLLCVITYVFAIAFVILVQESPEEKAKFFPTVWIGMWRMILLATVPDLQEATEEICMTSILTACVWVFFVFIVHLTILNMMVGVLVEATSVVSSVEREAIDLVHIRDHLLEMFANVDADNSKTVCIEEFSRLMRDAEVIRFLGSVDIDAIALIDYADVIFRGGAAYDYHEIINILLDFRGSKTSTVKDLADFRKWLDGELLSIREIARAPKGVLDGCA
jgi:hypothetical protein